MATSCEVCGKESVTKDGRNLCLKCLRAAIRAETHVPWSYGRGGGKRQAFDSGDNNPWGDNAVRALEGD
jgi:hypothetical protein